MLEAKCYTLSNRYYKTYIVSPYSCTLKQAVVSQTHDSLTFRSSAETEETSENQHIQEDERKITETVARNPDNPNNTPLDFACCSTMNVITVWGRERLRKQMRRRNGKQIFRLEEVRK